MFNRKSRRAAEKAFEATKPVPVDFNSLPEDLQKLAGAYRALDQTVQLLTIGLFPGAASAVVAQSVAFATELRSSTLADIRRHPEGSKVVPS